MIYESVERVLADRGSGTRINSIKKRGEEEREREKVSLIYYPDRAGSDEERYSLHND
jgi:hypothetical protein